MEDRVRSRRGTVFIQTGDLRNSATHSMNGPGSTDGKGVPAIAPQSPNKAVKDGPPVKVGPTYSLEPKENERFCSCKAKQVVARIVDEYLENVEFAPEMCPALTGQLSNTIKEHIKRELTIPRYKIVCVVLVSQKKGSAPGVHYVSRCLWNAQTDSYATVTASNSHASITASVYAVYHD